MDKEKIKHAFGQAACTYDAHACIQKVSSHKLISLTNSLPSPSYIYEIGCGTGYLTSELLQRHQDVPYIATDISENMISHCQKKFSSQHNPLLFFKEKDGEKVEFDVFPDWIISNFTFQWFKNQLTTIQHLYKNSQFLIFTTLLEGTFVEWKGVCEKFGVPDKVLPFLEESNFLENIKTLNPRYLSVETEKEFYQTPFSFLTRLKKIGAYKSLNHDSTENFRGMRNLLKSNEPLEISYRVAYCILNNTNQPRMSLLTDKCTLS